MQTRPWHMKPFAGLAVLAMAALAADAAMVKLRLTAYLDVFTAEQVTYFTTLPAWVDLVWMISVVLGLLGAVLLWMEERISVLPLGISAVGLTIFAIWLSVLSRPLMVSVTGWIGLLVVWGSVAVGALIYIYARRQRQMDRLG